MKYVDRCYAATIHFGHENFQDWLRNLAGFYDLGIVDYCCAAVEESRLGVVHINAFVVFNELAWKGHDKKNPFKPTKYLSADWRKARSLSGARDYSARRGIHVDKPGLIQSLEFGDWVDPAYNSSLRTRLSFEFGFRLSCGESVTSIALENPSGVLVVGEKNLEDLSSLRLKPLDEGMKTLKRPYYYIGRSDLENLMIEDHLVDALARQISLGEEEE